MKMSGKVCVAWVDKERQQQPKLISPTFDEGWDGNGVKKSEASFYVL